MKLAVTFGYATIVVNEELSGCLAEILCKCSYAEASYTTERGTEFIETKDSGKPTIEIINDDKFISLEDQASGDTE